MQLFLHVGTEKTGSSFLQTLSALGRNDLREKGIWFPLGTAYDEGCMKTGRISAGNGRPLAQKVDQGQWDALGATLKADRDKGRSASACVTYNVSTSTPFGVQKLLGPVPTATCRCPP